MLWKIHPSFQNFPWPVPGLYHYRSLDLRTLLASTAASPIEPYFSALQLGDMFHMGHFHEKTCSSWKHGQLYRSFCFLLWSTRVIEGYKGSSYIQKPQPPQSFNSTTLRTLLALLPHHWGGRTAVLHLPHLWLARTLT